VPRRPVGDMSNAELRFQEAVHDLTQFRRAWNRLGRPWSAVGSKGQLVAHPLVALIRQAEVAVERLSMPAAAHRGGRPVGASSAPDRRASRLKIVK
jgi:hypothetical protein